MIKSIVTFRNCVFLFGFSFLVGNKLKILLAQLKTTQDQPQLTALKNINTWVRSEAGFWIKLCKQNKPHSAWRVFLEITAYLFTTIRFLSQQIFTSHAVIFKRDDKGTWRGKNDPFVKRSSEISIFALFFYSKFFTLPPLRRCKFLTFQLSGG